MIAIIAPRTVTSTTMREAEANTEAASSRSTEVQTTSRSREVQTTSRSSGATTDRREEIHGREGRDPSAKWLLRI